MRANNLIQALNLFNPKKSLLTQEDLDNYFVARPKGSLIEMETYLRGVQEEVKILFTGHRGSGKSTELSKLTSLLTDKIKKKRLSMKQSFRSCYIT